MNVTAYLARIGYEGATTPSLETLRGLQHAHLLSVPFENLSIHAGEHIVLNEHVLFAKIVDQRRGGFCYEVNGLFAALLRTLGFEVSLLSAGVFDDEKGFGPAFDHMTLLVTLDELWLVDVGFGDSFREPLRLNSREEVYQLGRGYRLDVEHDQFVLMQLKDYDEGWRPQYRFTRTPCLLSDYVGMCEYHQTSPQSSFTHKTVCTRATTNGRITVSGDLLITTEMTGVMVFRQEEPLRSQAEIDAVLRERFGIVL